MMLDFSIFLVSILTALKYIVEMGSCTRQNLLNKNMIRKQKKMFSGDKYIIGDKNLVDLSNDIKKRLCICQLHLRIMFNLVYCRQIQEWTWDEIVCGVKYMNGQRKIVLCFLKRKKQTLESVYSSGYKVTEIFWKHLQSH